ncbi:MAG: hypothetical protein HY965_02870 [Ignavibacteriales bacterium]|nr:hypothetical protein [Ignavibacteriales bacterium]
MSLTADRKVIFDRLQTKFGKGDVGKSFKALFTNAKKKITVTFAGENGTESDSISKFSRDTNTRFAILVDTRDLDDDPALELVDEIKKLLHGLKLHVGDPDADRLIYDGTTFNDLSEGSGVWAHTMIFTKGGYIQPTDETFAINQ